MTSPGTSEPTICLNPAGLKKRTLWWRERDSVVRHADRSNYSHFRAVDLPISRCAAAQPRARREKNATGLFSSSYKAAFPPGRPLRNSHS